MDPDSEIDTKIMCGKSKIGQKTTKTEKMSHFMYTARSQIFFQSELEYACNLRQRIGMHLSGGLEKEVEELLYHECMRINIDMQ